MVIVPSLVSALREDHWNQVSSAAGVDAQVLSLVHESVAVTVVQLARAITLFQLAVVVTVPSAVGTNSFTWPVVMVAVVFTETVLKEVASPLCRRRNVYCVSGCNKRSLSWGYAFKTQIKHAWHEKLRGLSPFEHKTLQNKIAAYEQFIILFV